MTQISSFALHFNRIQTHTQTGPQNLRELFPYGYAYKEQWEIVHCFMLFPALFCYSRELENIPHVRDRAL